MTVANVVTINRPEVVALIEEAARKLTGGNKTEAVALAMRRLLDENARADAIAALGRLRRHRQEFTRRGAARGLISSSSAPS